MIPLSRFSVHSEGNFPIYANEMHHKCITFDTYFGFTIYDTDSTNMVTFSSPSVKIHNRWIDVLNVLMYKNFSHLCSVEPGPQTRLESIQSKIHDEFSILVGLQDEIIINYGEKTYGTYANTYLKTIKEFGAARLK